MKAKAKKKYRQVLTLSELKIGSLIYVSMDGRKFSRLDIRPRLTIEEFEKHLPPEDQRKVKYRENGWQKIYHAMKNKEETEEEFEEYRNILKRLFKEKKLYKIIKDD